MKLLLAVLAVLALLAGGCGSSEEGQGGGKQKAEKPTPERPKSTKQKLQDAIEDTPNVDVRNIDVGTTLSVELKTPEGGFSDVDGGDFDRHAQQTFGAIYGKAKYRRQRETVIVFKGGLADKATGKEIDANTAIYTLKRREANQIDWGDGDSGALYNIDWSIYRDFLHPAFQ